MEEEIDLLEYWHLFLKWKKMIAVIVALCWMVILIAVLRMPNYYGAEATLLPMGGRGGGGGMIFSSLAAQMGLGGFVGGGGGNSTSVQLLALLKSQTLAERLAEKYKLGRIFFPKLWDAKSQSWKVRDPSRIPSKEVVGQTLLAQMSFELNPKSQLLVIHSEMTDPRLAADMANAYVRELVAYINENTLTSAKKNRIFIEEQLERNKAEYLSLGKDLTSFYSMNKISNSVPTVDVDVSSVGYGRSSGDQTAPQGNDLPEMVGLDKGPDFSLPGVTNAFAEVQKQSNELQKKAEENKGALKEIVTVKGVPQQVYLQYLTLQRELLGQINSLLSQQYQMAKIEEGKEDLNFQTIDWARVPQEKLRPRRKFILMTAFFLSIFVALLIAFVTEQVFRIKGRQVLNS